MLERLTVIADALTEKRGAVSSMWSQPTIYSIAALRLRVSKIITWLRRVTKYSRLYFTSITSRSYLRQIEKHRLYPRIVQIAGAKFSQGTIQIGDGDA